MIIPVTDNIVLRTINLSDTDFILKITNDPKRKENLTREQHILFLEKCMEKGDYYFMIDWYNFPVSFPIGTVSIFNINKETKSAEWGRFILVEEFKEYKVLVEKKINDIALNILNLSKLLSAKTEEICHK